ncbi:Site-specific recombinase, phage integrase family [Leptospira santarosai]|nr:Site-specific recombinase, phage integrase family [Leptospira santarosai]
MYIVRLSVSRKIDHGIDIEIVSTSDHNRIVKVGFPIDIDRKTSSVVVYKIRQLIPVHIPKKIPSRPVACKWCCVIRSVMKLVFIRTKYAHISVCASYTYISKLYGRRKIPTRGIHSPEHPSVFIYKIRQPVPVQIHNLIKRIVVNRNIMSVECSCGLSDFLDMSR